MVEPWEKYQTGPWSKYADPTAAEYATGAIGGFNVGLTNLAGVPVDLATMGLNLIPGVDIQQPFGGSESIRRGMNVIGDFFPEPPPTAGGRFAARVGEELGAAALPSTAILGAARGVPKLAQMGQGLRQRLGQAFFDPIRRAPGLAAAGEAVAATGAGVGAATAQQVFPGNKTAEMFGQVFGGLTPALLAQMPSVKATQFVRWLIGKFSAETAAKEGAQAVQKALSDELTMEAERLLREADVLRKEMPGFDPSLGEATGSPAMLATQRSLEAAATGGELEQLAARRALSETAVEGYAARQAPVADEGPDFIIDTANQQIMDLRARADIEDVAVAAGRRRVAEGLPIADKPTIGEGIRTKILDARNAASLKMTALANKLGINTEDVTAPFDTWRKTILAELTPVSEFSDIAGLSAVRKALTRTRPKEEITPILGPDGRPLPRTETTNFQDVRAVRERLGDAIRDALGSATPNRKVVRSLIQARKSLDRFMATLADGDPSGRLKEFNAAYFNEYIKPFEAGTVFKVRMRDGRGFYRTTDEKVADAFWQPGNVSAARQYKALFGADPEANAALEAVALDSLRNAAVRDGVIKPNLFESWVRRHLSLLDEFPGIKRKVSGIEQADQALIARQGAVNTRRQLIEDQVLTRELNAYAGAAKTSEQVIEAAVRDSRKMAQLVRTLKEGPAEALDALRRNIWDRALEGDIPGFLAANADSLGALFTPAHIKSLNAIASARAMHARIPPPRGAGYKPVPLAGVESAIGQGIPQIGSRIFAFKSGRMQKGYLVLDTFMRGLRGRAQTSAEDLFRVALYDPEIAKAMANAVNVGSMPTTKATQLQARYFALAPTAVEDER